jgi:indole-3-acetate monooxygenase
MAGTGSATISLEDAFVPERMTFHVGPLTGPVPAMSGPLPRMFPLLNVMGEASVAVGIAAEAVARLRVLAETKIAAFTAPVLRDRELMQYLVGKAHSRVQAARAYLHQASAAAYDEAVGGPMSMDTKLELQLAVAYATEAGAEAVRYVHEAVGASGIRVEAGFERLFRDAHTITQHANRSTSRYGTAGRLLFGLPNDWLTLAL